MLQALARARSIAEAGRELFRFRGENVLWSMTLTGLENT